MPGVPSAPYAIIGGSITAAVDFPAGLRDPRVRVVDEVVRVGTPFGELPRLQLVDVATPSGVPRRVLVALMHGWTGRRPRHEAALALFWALREAGVRRIIAEFGSGSLIQNFRPRDLVLPHDVFDATPQVGGRIDPSLQVLMHEPFCPEIRAALSEHGSRWASEKASRMFDRAVLAVTEGPRFETAAEASAFVRLGAEITGQSVSPEVYLAREIGACYATATVVLNYAEGVRPRWDYDLLQQILREDAPSLGVLLLDTLVDLPEPAGCACVTYRRPVTTGQGIDTA